MILSEKFINCLHVPSLEKDLLLVPHMDMEMKWRTLFEGGACVVDDRCRCSVKYKGELDCDAMLYMVLI